MLELDFSFVFCNTWLGCSIPTNYSFMVFLKRNTTNRPLESLEADAGIFVKTRREESAVFRTSRFFVVYHELRCTPSPVLCITI